MPRQRMINPEFWVDDTLSQTSLNARLLYIGIWNFSDDYGVIENNIIKLKAQVFPYDTIKIQPLVEELVKAHRLLPFEAENKSWFYIKNFLKWQKVEKPSKWRNPPFILPDHSPTTTPPVVAEEKRREENVETTHTSFFEDKEQQEQILKWLTENGNEKSFASQELIKFVSYWTEPNQKGKPRWKGEKYFDIKRRLATWFSRIK